MALDCMAPEAMARLWEGARTTAPWLFIYPKRPIRSHRIAEFWAYLAITGRLAEDGGPRTQPNVPIMG